MLQVSRAISRPEAEALIVQLMLFGNMGVFINHLLACARTFEDRNG
jgi:hypothetical protein